MNPKNSYQSFEFPGRWISVSEFAIHLENELQKEVTKGHLLFSLPVRAIAKRIDNDDVLFEVDCPNFRFAKVHLTYQGIPEQDPQWPFTEVFKSIDDWVVNECNQLREEGYGN